MIPFLFIAEYSDGQLYQQTPEDVSRQNPMKSAFYDIRQSPLIPEERLVKFGLIRTRLPVLVATVELRTGCFAINRVAAPTPPDAPRKQEGTPLRLLYEKRNELELTSGRHTVTYRIGWQCGDEWLALDLGTAPEKITLRGSHERTTRSELAAALVG